MVVLLVKRNLDVEN